MLWGDVTASSATVCSQVTITNDAAGNVVFTTRIDRNSVRNEGNSALLRQWIESPANDLSYTLAAGGSCVGQDSVLHGAFWDSSTDGVLSLARNGGGARCEPGESPIGVDGTTSG